MNLEKWNSLDFPYEWENKSKFSPEIWRPRFALELAGLLGNNGKHSEFRNYLVHFTYEERDQDNGQLQFQSGLGVSIGIQIYKMLH